MTKNKTMVVNETKVGITTINDSDYICLTDIVKNHDGDDHIRNWLRNRNTVEFIGLWEQMHNPDFKPVEFDGFRKQVGLNSFNLSPKKWVESTGAIGIISKSGRYGGTYAHKDIAFEFASWLDPVFKLYMIKEYQRLKEAETNEYNLEWDVNRIISKINYRLHTDAVKDFVVPNSTLPANMKGVEYANEADILNVAVFGFTAKQWKDANPKAILQKGNIRDTASINELAVLSNLESLNSEMIKDGATKEARAMKLNDVAKRQLSKLNDDGIKALKKLNNNTYVDAKNNVTLDINPSRKPITEEGLSQLNKNLKKALNHNPKAE